MLFGYTWIQWVFFFFLYSFLGWCFESTYVSFMEKKPVNRGFIRGPFLPLYGAGALMMLIVSMPFQDSLFWTYIAGCVGATVLEYVTGVTMEALFKVRYWEYFDQKFNFQGRICLSSSLTWGVFTILMTRFLHKPMEWLAFWLPEWLLTAGTMFAAAVFIVDFTLSFRAALDLRDLLIRMDQAKKELERMQKRLDMIIAMGGEATEKWMKEREAGFSGTLGNLAMRWDELVAGIEERFARLKEAIPVSKSIAEKRDELLELRSRFGIYLAGWDISRYMGDFIRRGLIKGNPRMVSRRFSEALEAIKQSAQEYRKKKKDEE